MNFSKWQGAAWAAAHRLTSSAVAWSLVFNFLRLASGILLLPLALRLLSEPDLGMYYLFLQLNGILLLLDFGFAPTFGRFAAYAMGGAKKITARGLTEEPPHGAPNYPLLWELLVTARVFYRYLALTGFCLLALGGSLVIALKAGETSHPQLTWLAWVVAVLAATSEAYLTMWNMFLRGIDRVMLATRVAVIAYGLRIGLACGLFLAGAGLLSLPLASLVTSLLAGWASRRECLRQLGPAPDLSGVDHREHLRTIWPNAWRLGLLLGTGYLSATATLLLCSLWLGLVATGRYGLSLQVINLVAGMASVWTYVKWPIAGQLVARGDVPGVRRLLWPRLLLNLSTFALLAVAAVALGPPVVHWVGSKKEMLPLLWLVLLAINGFLEAHLSFWNTLISLWNELPMLKAAIAGSILSFVINAVLVIGLKPEPGLLVLGPLIAGLLLNYWRWPAYGARKLGLTWPRFMTRQFA